MLYQHSLKFTISLGSLKRRKSTLRGEVYSPLSVHPGSANHGLPTEGQLYCPVVHRLLSTRRFWYLREGRGSWNQDPMDTEVQLRVATEAKRVHVIHQLGEPCRV